MLQPTFSFTIQKQGVNSRIELTLHDLK